MPRCAGCDLRHLPICTGEHDRAQCAPERRAERHRRSLFASSLAGWPALHPAAPPHPAEPDAEPITLEPAKSILITGGIGDFLALDGFLPDDYRAGLRRIIWANPEHAACAALVDACPAWPRVEHVFRWPGSAGRPAFYGAAEVADAYGPETIATADDWSIGLRFPQAASGRLAFRGSAFARAPLADLSRFALPARYAAIHSGTDSTHRLTRYFTAEDWEWTLDELRRIDRLGVVVGRPHEEDALPDDPRLIDLRGRTSLAEAVEVVKRSDAYIGINSCFSVVAAWHLTAGRLAVANRLPFLTQWAGVYYPAHQDLGWITPRLASLSLDPGADAITWRPLPGHPREEWAPDLSVAREVARIPTADYGEAYTAKYRGYAATELGRRLNEYRVGLARRFAGTGTVLDFGIGCGSFLDSWLATTGVRGWGHDVGAEAVRWLQERSMGVDPYREPWPANAAVLTAWDSLEHVPDLPALLERVPPGTILLTSLPLFDDLTRLSLSKHYRPGEHHWYFTAEGLTRFLGRYGFDPVLADDGETRLGRESIGTFAFRRRGGATAEPAAPELVAARLAACAACDRLTADRRCAACAACGTPPRIEMVARLAGGRCLRGRWPQSA